MTAVVPPAPPTPPAPPITATPPPPQPGGDRFVRPGLGWNLLLQPGIVATVVLALSPKAYEAAAAKAPLPPQNRMRALAAGAVGLHLFEGFVAYRTAKGKGYTRSAKRWGIEGFLLGFPVLLKLRKQPIR
jgi:hypothetical protein